MPTNPAPPTDLPETTVVAGVRRRLFDLEELWRYRDLLRFLVRRHVRARYKQTFLGILWAVLQPVVTMVVFSVVLGRLVGVASEGVPYPVFAFLGILPWSFFAQGVGRGTTSLVNSANLITEVYFPRVLIPTSATLAALVDWAIAFGVLLAIMAGYGMAPSPGTLLLVPLMLLTALIATGIGIGLAAVNVRWRDVGHAIPFLLQVWMFLTPVVYPLSYVPEEWRLVYALNPATGLVQAMRDAVLGRPLDLPSLGISVAVGLLLAVAGAWLFQREERRFADLV